jgi:hypothetical protein
MSLSSLTSLATTAFDTARSTIKAISDAAVTPDENRATAGKQAPGKQAPGKQAPGKQAQASKAAVAEKAAPTAAERIEAARMRAEQARPQEKPTGRRGTVLDALA